MPGEEKTSGNTTEDQEVVGWQQSAEITPVQSDLEKQTKDNPPPTPEAPEIKPYAGFVPSLFGALRTIDIESINSLSEAKSMLKVMAHLIDQKEKENVGMKMDLRKDREDREKTALNYSTLKETHSILEAKFESARATVPTLS